MHDDPLVTTEIVEGPTPPSLRDMAMSLAEYITLGVDRVLPRLEADIASVVDGSLPASELAHIYAIMRQTSEKWAEVALMLGSAVTKLGGDLIPEAFEREDITSFATSLGYRVGVAMVLRASIKPETKMEAYDWLRANGLADLITETVNASTLAAAGKHLLTEGKELDEDLFNCHFQKTTSLTKIAKKK